MLMHVSVPVQGCSLLGAGRPAAAASLASAAGALLPPVALVSLVGVIGARGCRRGAGGDRVPAASEGERVSHQRVPPRLMSLSGGWPRQRAHSWRQGWRRRRRAAAGRARAANNVR